MDIKKAREILLRDSEFKKEYYKKDLAFEIAKILIEARIIKNVTQAELAKIVGTKQPSIARIERGESLPSLRFLQKIANAFHTYLIPPMFGFMDKSHKVDTSSLNATHDTNQSSTNFNTPYNFRCDSIQAACT